MRLVREPNNLHDPNAIAIYAATGGRAIGYVNKQNAARLAKIMDAGEEIAAICTRGGRGGDDAVPAVLAARRDVLAHLTRNL